MSDIEIYDKADVVYDGTQLRFSKEPIHIEKLHVIGEDACIDVDKHAEPQLDGSYNVSFRLDSKSSSQIRQFMARMDAEAAAEIFTRPYMRLIAIGGRLPRKLKKQLKKRVAGLIAETYGFHLHTVLREMKLHK